MRLNSSLNVHYGSASAALYGRLSVIGLAQWVQHYQAETVDLRYFFHSGWSS